MNSYFPCVKQNYNQVQTIANPGITDTLTIGGIQIINGRMFQVQFDKHSQKVVLEPCDTLQTASPGDAFPMANNNQPRARDFQLAPSLPSYEEAVQPSFQNRTMSSHKVLFGHDHQEPKTPSPLKQYPSVESLQLVTPVRSLKTPLNQASASEYLSSTPGSRMNNDSFDTTHRLSSTISLRESPSATNYGNFSKQSVVAAVNNKDWRSSEYNYLPPPSERRKPPLPTIPIRDLNAWLPLDCPQDEKDYLKNLKCDHVFDSRKHPKWKVKWQTMIDKNVSLINVARWLTDVGLDPEKFPGGSDNWFKLGGPEAFEAVTGRQYIPTVPISVDDTADAIYSPQVSNQRTAGIESSFSSENKLSAPNPNYFGTFSHFRNGMNPIATHQMKLDLMGGANTLQAANDVQVASNNVRSWSGSRLEISNEQVKRQLEIANAPLKHQRFDNVNNSLHDHRYSIEAPKNQTKRHLPVLPTDNSTNMMTINRESQEDSAENPNHPKRQKIVKDDVAIPLSLSSSSKSVSEGETLHSDEANSTYDADNHYVEDGFLVKDDVESIGTNSNPPLSDLSSNEDPPNLIMGTKVLVRGTYWAKRGKKPKYYEGVIIRPAPDVLTDDGKTKASWTVEFSDGAFDVLQEELATNLQELQTIEQRICSN